MAIKLRDILGSRCTREGEKVTIYLDDFKDSSGNPIFNDPQLHTTNGDIEELTDENGNTTVTGVSANAVVATILKGIWSNSQPIDSSTGEFGGEPKQGIVGEEGYTDKTFITRSGESQIKHELYFAIYQQDNTSLDPDKVVY